MINAPHRTRLARFDQGDGDHSQSQGDPDVDGMAFAEQDHAPPDAGDGNNVSGLAGPIQERCISGLGEQKDICFGDGR